MTRVRKGNVILKIEERQLKKFVALGYTEIDTKGKYVPTEAELSVAAEKKELIALRKENEELKQQIAEVNSSKKAARATKVSAKEETVTEE